MTCRREQEYKKKDRTQKVMEKALPTQTPFPSAHINQILHVRSYPRYLSWFQVSLKSVEKCELWGVEISAFPLTWHIAYTTACCYRTSHDSVLLVLVRGHDLSHSTNAVSAGNREFSLPLFHLVHSLKVTPFEFMDKLYRS